MNNKRGLSGIVTVLMFILLAFVAVGLIWGVVINIVQSGADQVDLSSKCLELDLSVTQTNCIDGLVGGGDNCSITIKRKGAGDAIGGIKLVLTNVTAEENFIHDEAGNINPLELKTVQIDNTSISNVNSVDILPYLVDEFGNDQDCTV